MHYLGNENHLVQLGILPGRNKLQNVFVVEALQDFNLCGNALLVRQGQLRQLHCVPGNLIPSVVIYAFENYFVCASTQLLVVPDEALSRRLFGHIH